VTGVVFQPVGGASGDRDAVTTGAVRSMLSVMLAVAVLPARSRAVPEMTWFAPSVETRTAAGQNARRTSSAHVNRTRTAVRYQPLAFGSVVAATVMVGGVTSTTCAVA
jgi:hypothetical protein